MNELFVKSKAMAESINKKVDGVRAKSIKAPHIEEKAVV